MDEKDVIIAACAATIIAGSVLLQTKTREITHKVDGKLVS